ncbi:MAG: glutathione peroxidase [Bacteroidaceae bacterium]|nr:glutathione peroxidase [Bacteroidaceae bacterium]
MTKITDFTATGKGGQEHPLAQYAGKVLLIVNTASKCGFTPQYEGLEKLHQQYKDRGLVVLGFPCAQFGNQEFHEEGKITEFCQLNYGVSFPIMKRIDVNGDAADPIFQWLKAQAPGLLGKRIMWNFTKFLIAPDGTTVKRYSTLKKPENMAKDIEALLPG